MAFFVLVSRDVAGTTTAVVSLWVCVVWVRCAGVPVPLKRLDGVDSLYSILQMPKGVRLGPLTRAAPPARLKLRPHQFDNISRRTLF